MNYSQVKVRHIFPLKKEKGGGSKMVTGTQPQTVSSVTQGPCWDTGAVLGRGKAPGKAKTSVLWTPSLWKASPCHNLLKERLACQAPTNRPKEPPLYSAGPPATQAHQAPGLRGPTGSLLCWEPTSQTNQAPAGSLLCLMGPPGPQSSGPPGHCSTRPLWHRSAGSLNHWALPCRPVRPPLFRLAG
jgi:hypothetical protein